MPNRVNILIVDDLPEKVLVVKSILEELGENIHSAYSGTDALRLVLEQDFAVILLDVNMPDIDGFETARLIRSRRKSAHTPIIFITSYTDEMHAAQGYALGAVDYILAPVIPEVLRTKVKVFVDLFRMHQEIKRQAEQRVALAREQAARAAAEEATRRANFLVRASTALTTPLDYEAAVAALLRVAAPELCDLAGVTRANAPGASWQSDLAWVVPPDPTLHTARLEPTQAPDDVLRQAVETALRSGQMQVLHDLAIAYPPTADAAARGVLRAAVVLPLLARGRVLGTLTLASTTPERHFGLSQLALVEDLANRAAVALDNARLYQSLREADRHKNEFLAMLAHELRNPLAPIRNAVEVMRLVGSQAGPVAQARDMIDRQVTHMARLIDDLLDMSRISRGKVLLRKQRLDLTALVRDVAEDHRRSLEAGGLQVTVELPATALWTVGDPTRLAQVLGNVLHNAAKFTDAGGAVAVVLQRAADEKTALVTIRDTGIGMEPAMLGRVFDTFSQADSSLDRSRGGLGLGLALVKGLVELHGGTVGASSPGLNQGTEIRIRLPLREPAATTAPVAPPAPNARAAKPARVLVIEDNEDAAASLHMLLSLAGHQVETAPSGQAGLAAVPNFQPEVVVCDIGLPGGMDGYAVARALRQQPAHGGMLLIALTGYGQDGDKEMSLEAGFDIHLTKPVDFEELQGLLASGPLLRPRA